MGVSIGLLSTAAAAKSITTESGPENGLPSRVACVMNRSNSFHALRQIPVTSDPRKLEPLTDAENKNLLVSVIKELAGNAKPQQEPVVHIITGQMGAGKSTVTNNISAKLDGDCLVIDYDELKQFIPGYTEEASKGYPGTVPGCKETARYLVDGLRNHGFENRLNMVIQESINGRDEEMYKLAEACKENNFRVSLTVLAVDKATSTLGILSRYESALKSINVGAETLGGARRTPAAYHDDAYKSLVDARKFERLMPNLDEIIVSGRNGEAFYQSSTDFSPEEIVGAIELGRNNTQSNRAELFDRLQRDVEFNASYKNPELK
ncbi:zeta toxin family protein [Pseudomonas hormoni]|uniref:Zeta toxin family protein n=1 Tax=Pseudomonas hormoni TaxID=3093767 RepID=A0ABX8EQN3_9PSED|nr:zeta toxin family protein [Pseudomonas hormoni]QVW21969.1 zeta toxin family protein [Pseudomonas hormoni]